MNKIIKTSWLCNNLENNMNHLLNGFLILYVCVQHGISGFCGYERP